MLWNFMDLKKKLLYEVYFCTRTGDMLHFCPAMVLFKWIKLACFQTSSMGIPDHFGPSLPSFYSVLL